jgi:UTP--glucose-1-phosphate uridylyltransferase
VRRRHDVRLPLVLMNSPHTRADSVRALDRYPDLAADVPADFLQHRVPKIGADDLQPAHWPANPELEWCPPGHGDLYVAPSTSGMLDWLLERGYEHAFVSNADNLGAVVEPRIVSWLAAERVPFAMEVVVGTEADRKGGHIARRDGRLVLRETAQTPPEDADSFRDVGRWRFYNMDNLWIHLPTLAEVLSAREGALGLPLIVNRKTVDPADPESPAVIQLETAMGAAIGGVRWRAREEGVDTFTALMLVENGQMMDLFERLGAVRVLDRAAGIVEVEVHLPAIGVSPELRKLIRLAAASDIAIPIGQLPRGQRTRPGLRLTRITQSL